MAGTWTGPRVAGILLLAGGLSAATCLFADTAGSGLAAIVVALRSLVRLQIAGGRAGCLSLAAFVLGEYVGSGRRGQAPVPHDLSNRLLPALRSTFGLAAFLAIVSLIFSVLL